MSGEGLLDGSAASEAYEAEVGGEPDPTSCELGTIGWAGDDQLYDDLGSDSNDGNTFVKVTLYKGHPTGVPMLPAVAPALPGANGHQYLCRLTWPLWVIPTAGMQCVVLFPGGHTRTPGAGLVVAVLAKTPSRNFKATTAKLDLTGYDLVIKARTITFRDDDNNLIGLSPEGGCRMVDKTGSGFFMAEGKGVIQTQNDKGKMMACVSLDQESCGMVLGAASPTSFIKLKGGDAHFMCVNYNVGAFGAIALGMGATPASGVACGPGGAPGIASLCSLSIFGRP